MIAVSSFLCIFAIEMRVMCINKMTSYEKNIDSK